MNVRDHRGQPVGTRSVYQVYNDTIELFKHFFSQKII